QQAATAVVVLAVGLEVLGELLDAGGEEGDLHLRRAGVVVVDPVVVDHLLLRCGRLRQGHSPLRLSLVLCMSARAASTFNSAILSHKPQMLDGATHERGQGVVSGVGCALRTPRGGHRHVNTIFGCTTPIPPPPMRSMTVPTAMNSLRRFISFTQSPSSP